MRKYLESTGGISKITSDILRDWGTKVLFSEDWDKDKGTSFKPGECSDC